MNFMLADDWTTSMNTERQWDAFGSIHRPKESLQHSRTIDYVDLRMFDDCYVVPIGLPANYHFYWNGHGGINSETFVVKSRKYRTIEEIHEHLRRPGLHYVLYAAYHDACVLLRSHTIPVDSDSYRSSLIPKCSVTAQLAGPAITDITKYPHRCPHCSRPAYVGLNQVDCSGGCR